jgi:peroxiredoxin
MFKKLFTITLLMLAAFSAQSQQKGKYKLQFKVDGVKDSTVYLARYYGDKLYYTDTTVADSKGNITFTGADIEGGIYAVVIPGPMYFEVIVAENEIIMETKKEDFAKHMIIKKSEENKAFYEYINFLGNKRKEAEPLQNEFKVLDKDKQKDRYEEVQGKLIQFDKEVKGFQRDFVKRHDGKFASKVIGMSIEMELPDAPKDEEGNQIDPLFQYKYATKNFFNNFDFNDERIVRTPVFHNKLDFYFQKILVQHPDTICKEATQLISKIKEGTELFKYVVHHITYTFETSKIMGMDAVFVCMGKNYYCPVENSKAFWMKQEKLKELCDRVNSTEPLLLGKKAPQIILVDTTEQNWIDLYKVNAPHTILMFWDPDCGHCKKEMPKMIALYDKYKEKGVKVVAVSTNLDNKDWKKYVKDKKLEWINLSDSPEINKNAYKYVRELGVTTVESLNFRQAYDIFSTPQIYLLDSTKIIRAKKMDATGLDKILAREYGMPEGLHIEEDDQGNKNK